MPHPLIEIQIFRKGRGFALREWPVVPRVGDFIELKDTWRDDPVAQAFRISRVVWNEDPRGNVRVFIDVEEVK